MKLSISNINASFRSATWAIILLFVSNPVHAYIFVSSGSASDWNTAATWNRFGTGAGNTTPGFTDDVIITGGISITVASGTAECASLTLNDPLTASSPIAQVDVSSGASLLVYGAVSLGSTDSNNDKITLNGSAIFRFASVSGGIVAFDITQSIIDINSAAAVNFPAGTGTSWVNLATSTATSTFKMLKINAPVTINTSLNVYSLLIGDERSSAILDDGSNSIIINSAGSLQMKNSAKYIYRATVPNPFVFRAGDVIDANTTFELNNTGDFTLMIDDNAKFQNLSINGTGVKTIDANSLRALNIGGNLTLNSQVVLTTRISAVNINGNYMPSTQLLNAGTRPVALGGDWLDTAVQPMGGTFTYNGAGNQIVGALAYKRLVLTNGGVKTISSPFSATIEPAGLVTVNSNTTFNANGKLYLLANSTDNANIAPLTNGAAITGDVVVQSFFTGGGLSANRSYRTISSPIKDDALSSGKSIEQLKSYMIITGPGGTANGFDPGGTASSTTPTVLRYNEPALSSAGQYTPVPSVSDALYPGEGVFLFFRGDRSNYTTATASTSKKVNPPYLAPEDVLMQYIGPINQGDVMVPLSFTDNQTSSDDELYNGFNLVGNPYPATINWDLVEKVNANGQISIYKPGGGYASYLNGISTNGSNVNIIQPGQGFWARATSTGASITFKEVSKAVNSSSGRFLSVPKDKMFASTASISQNVSGGNNWKQLRINLQDAVNKDETVIVFDKNSHSQAGFEDASYFGGSTVSLSTLSSDNMNLAINFMPDISEVTELKLNVNASISGSVKLSFTDLTATRNYSVLLSDSYTGQLTDVKARPVYEFNINKSDAATFGIDRFKLLFQPPVVLPVALVSFEAKKKLKGAEISWKTASEQANDRFELEHSADGKAFSTIATIKGKGNSSSMATYNYLDENPFNGPNYYRLKQVDLDGKSIYSNIISLNYTLDNRAVEFVLYPNPVVNDIFIDYVESWRPNSFAITIFDSKGKQLGKSVIPKDQQLKQNVSSLDKGVYILQVSDAETNAILGKSKFLKN